MAEFDNPDTFARETANDRFKEGFGNWFWTGLAVATILHFLAFAFWPQMSVADTSFDPEELEAVDLPEDIEIPPPPEQIARPATPVISASADISEDITIAPTTFEDNPIDELPPPPASDRGALSEYQAFSPSMVRPRPLNRSELSRLMQRHYPTILKDAGIGGTTVLGIWIDENGVVQRATIAKSSGHPQLDEAAMKVVDLVEFSPAMNRDQRVPVRMNWGIVWSPQ